MGHELLLAADVFDSVLEQAKHLNHTGYKDPSAVLGRVVLEDTLKRLARRRGIADDQKASVLNDELKKSGEYAQPQWRQVQVWLDIGNDAAHGNFGSYDQAGIASMLPRHQPIPIKSHLSPGSGSCSYLASVVGRHL